MKVCLSILAAMVMVVAVAAPANADWTYRETRDSLTGATFATATASKVGQPYRTATLTVRCRNSKLDVFIAFGYLNLTGGNVYGRHVLTANFRTADVNTSHNMVFLEGQERRSLFYSTQSGNTSREFAITLAGIESFALGLPYYNHGRAVPRWTMEGADDAIGRVMQQCPVRVRGRYTTPEDNVASNAREAIRRCFASNSRQRKVSRCVNAVQYDAESGHWFWES